MKSSHFPSRMRIRTSRIGCFLSRGNGGECVIVSPERSSEDTMDVSSSRRRRRVRRRERSTAHINSPILSKFGRLMCYGKDTTPIDFGGAVTIWAKVGGPKRVKMCVCQKVSSWDFLSAIPTPIWVYNLRIKLTQQYETIKVHLGGTLTPLGGPKGVKMCQNNTLFATFAHNIFLDHIPTPKLGIDH